MAVKFGRESVGTGESIVGVTRVIILTHLQLKYNCKLGFTSIVSYKDVLIPKNLTEAYQRRPAHLNHPVAVLSCVTSCTITRVVLMYVNAFRIVLTFIIFAVVRTFQAILP